MLWTPQIFVESNIFFFVWILDYYFAGVFDYAGNTPITEYRMAKYSNGIWTEVQEVINAQVLCGNHSILYYSAIYPGGGQVFPIGAIDTLSNETIFSYVPKLAGGVNDPNMVLAIYVYENLVFYSGTFAIQLSGSTTASSGKFFFSIVAIRFVFLTAIFQVVYYDRVSQEWYGIGLPSFFQQVQLIRVLALSVNVIDGVRYLAIGGDFITSIGGIKYENMVLYNLY